MLNIFTNKKRIKETVNERPKTKTLSRFILVGKYISKVELYARLMNKISPENEGIRASLLKEIYFIGDVLMFSRTVVFNDVRSEVELLEKILSIDL